MTMPRRLLTLLVVPLLAIGRATGADEPDRRPRVAVITTAYYHNSHADVIASRLLEGYTLDGRGPRPDLRLATLFTDQVPTNDTSRELAARHGFTIHDTVAGALTAGGDTLAVDGVLLIAEHGSYPESDTGQIIYPKRRLFGEILEVFTAAGRVVPVFCDKHLADTWTDARWISDEAARRGIPLLAGSSVPGTWRRPAADVEAGRPLREIVALSYHRLDAYGFHALEMVQALAERRAGGETGVRQVRCLRGADAWRAFADGTCDRRLLDRCFSALQERPLPPGSVPEQLCPDADLFVIDYRDGLRAGILSWSGDWHVVEWSAAWRYADRDESAATLFWTQEARPFMHFTRQLEGIEELVRTGRPPWPVERTLLTSGLLDALLVSRRDGSRPVETPWLDLAYRSNWTWREPPPPPPGRPIDGP